MKQGDCHALRGGWHLAVLVLVLCTPGVVDAGGSRLWCSLESGPYEVGFRLIESHDLTRSFDNPQRSPRGDTPLGSRAGVSPRPVQISVFYPAVKIPGAAPVPFRDFVFHSAKEASYGSPSDAEKQSAIDRVRGSVGSQRELKRFEQLMAEPTATFLQATPTPGSFPLILLAPGRNGSPLSELILMEYLASHGFVLAAIPSQGSRGPIVTGVPGDLENQTEDLEHVMTELHEFSTANQERIGAIGYSMGGAAVTLLELRNPKVAALVTLDGSEVSQRRWSVLRQSPSFDAMSMDAPRLRLHAGGPDRAGLSSYKAMFRSRRYIVGFPLLRHEDFTSWALINDWLWNRDPQAVSAPRAAYQLICRHVLAFFKAYLSADGRSLKILEKGPSKLDYPRGFFTTRVLKPRR